MEAAPSRPLRIVGPWELSSLDPLRNGYLFPRMQVTETLVDFDDAGRAKPALAAGWQVSADGLHWRFAVRPAARFHDGTPVRAADVVTALERARHPAGVLGHAPIEAIVAGPGSDHVTIRLQRPFSSLLALLSHSSAQILAPASFGANGAVRAIVGSGPYRIVRLEPPQRFAVEAFDGWRGPRPAVRHASYLSVGRAEMRALMAEAGQAELAYGLDPASIVRLRRGRAVSVLGIEIPRTTALKLNAAHPLLAEPDARRALAVAIDRRGIAQAILREPALAAGQLFPPTLSGWHQSALPAWGHAPVQAREWLHGLGWRAGADGVLRRAGQRFALTLTTFPDRPELPVIAAAIQEQMRLIGVQVRVAVGNSSEVPLGHRDGSLEMALIARNYGVVPDAYGTVAQDFDADGGDWGAMGWQSASLVDAVRALRGSTDPAVAAPLRARIASEIHHGLPLIPVVWYRQTVAVSRRLDGVTIDPFERSYRLTDMRWTS
ncbi:peptide/nickel transport system substrate-binding protein [Cupriavidus gilardii J11]|uniref:Peptide/nickel transport system substrate-binding protein n=1 Tax=Cupriavidus gilardii J11 TaxID=936133 RepID=A0A562BS01_9BURK|nr:ABC transporter substrate-binding protein [Cupriavidus gilardii]TWG87543.1 peptide/nickel transport system substrate-binding protein [Cupriavidus gilardii J11]